MIALWKTLVEKSVENVENSQLSTGISLFIKKRTACGKDCILSCITDADAFVWSCYVTAPFLVLGTKIITKVYNL